MVNIVCLIFITPIRSKPTAASSSKDRLTECFDDQRCFRQIRSGGVYSLKKFVDFYDDTVLFGGWWQCNFCLLKESTRFCPIAPRSLSFLIPAAATPKGQGNTLLA